MGAKSFLSCYFNGKKSIFSEIFLVSATAVTALARPSQARTARRRCCRVTLDPASIAPSVRTSRVTTSVCAGQVHVSEFKTALHLEKIPGLHLHKVCYHAVSISNTSNILCLPRKSNKSYENLNVMRPSSKSSKMHHSHCLQIHLKNHLGLYF